MLKRSKLIHIGWICLISAIFYTSGPKPAYAFNPITDFQQNLQWTVGSVASAGTGINLKDGTLNTSELAQLATYRFISAWYGMTQLKDTNDSNFTMTDTAKLGFNVGYFFTGFKNQPPTIISNLVIGPSIACPVFSQLGGSKPVTYLFDINYSFK